MRILVSLALLCIPLFADSFQPPSANLAKGAPYTLDPPPNYSYCTEPGDATQLTDGIYTEAHFWTQPSTVGWTNARPALITIDLGADKPIKGLSYTTAAGVAGVQWPVTIQLFVAGEDKQFHWVGDLVTLSARKQVPPADVYALHRFWTDELQAHGRYVALAALAEPFCFVDEIEVYEGDPAFMSIQPTGEAIPDIKDYLVRMAVRVAVQRRILADCQEVGNMSVDSTLLRNPGTPEALTELLGSVKKDIADLPAVFPEDFKAILPLNEIHARVFRAQALLWAGAGVKPLAVWRSPVWDPLAPISVSQAASPVCTVLKDFAPPRIELYMMQNEYRAAAFNLSNATQADTPVSFCFTGLPGGATPPCITVHRAEWTDTKAGRPVAAALPVLAPVDGAYHVTARPGLTQQIWLTVHPTDLPAGEYTGAVSITADGAVQELPVVMKVYPIRFPDKPRLHLGGWDYTDQAAMYGVTKETRAELVAQLKEHFVDSPWATSAVLPHGQYEADGHMIAPPDTTNFDNWVALWPGMAQYCIFASVSDSIRSWKMGTPEFNRAARDWFAFWGKHVKEKGIDPATVAVLLFDEPSAPEHDAYTDAWAKPLREAGTGMRLWVDPTNHDMSIATSASVAACDVICPNRQIFYDVEQPYRDFCAKLPATGKSLDFYSCSGPVRSLDPYTYHRLQAWDCWRYGAKSSFFWAFGDTGGGSSWNEYAARGSCYTPLYLDAVSVTPGKHMEACRESVEDYEYLALLQDAVNRGEQGGVDAALLDRARTLLAEGPVRVTDPCFESGFDWQKPKDRTVADVVRKEILDLLVAFPHP